MKTFNQLLKELYGEPDDSTFIDNGDEYDLNGILSATLGMEIQDFSVSKLVWIFEYDNPYDESDRVEVADINTPILVRKEGSQLVVIDGLHRLGRAAQEGRAKIKGILVPDSLLRRYLIK